ncbi:MAG TPA: NAD(P)/FAD-dependent oxidoreductase [Oculatellaceae cyanobacterium]
MADKAAVIIGAGPAGLTAAFELLERTDVKPIILEKSPHIGGLSRTIEYKGNRIDIGPHRFFSKSDRVMDWWMRLLPLQASEDRPHEITYQQKTRTIAGSPSGPDPLKEDKVMLTLQRQTRIYYLRKFFDYPVSLKAQTLANLGLWRTMKIGVSYLFAAAFPIKPEENLEQFFINRFGKELYLTFFKDYTEKVWGIQCEQISADWGAQRVKGLSIMKTLGHAFKKIIGGVGGIRQKETETSLVEQFLFPKLGTGQMWEEVARIIREKGGEIHVNRDVTGITIDGNQVKSIEVKNIDSGEKETFTGNFFFSTMPMQELVRCLSVPPPAHIKEISEGLVYRDFIEVGLLVNKLKVSEDSPTGKRLIADNWIYIQESDVLVGRMQIWNNWGPCMVADPSKVWLGLEYFCYETDPVWKLSDEEMIKLAKEELEKIGIANQSEVIDGMVLRVEKTYPGYFGTYDRFDTLREYLDKYENLFLIGRNGQHRYNNQDHSMLAAMTAVDNIATGITSKENIWAVNTEMEYHEEKASSS